MRTAQLNQYANDRNPCNDVRILLDKIPAPLHGLFSLTVERGKAITLEMQPDNVNNAMIDVKSDGTKAMRHDGFTRKYENGELRALIDTPDNRTIVPTESVAASVFVKGEPASAYYAGDYQYADKQFRGSYMLSTLLSPDAVNLPDDERDLLNGIAEKIPSSLQGAFTVNLVSDNNGDTKIDRLMIAPDTIMEMLAGGVLKPVSQMRAGNAPQPLDDMEQLRMRRHTSALEIGRHQLQALCNSTRDQGWAMGQHA